MKRFLKNCFPIVIDKIENQTGSKKNPVFLFFCFSVILVFLFALISKRKEPTRGNVMVCIHVKTRVDAPKLSSLQQQFSDASLDVQFDSGNFNFLCEVSDAEEVMDILHHGGFSPSVE